MHESDILDAARKEEGYSDFDSITEMFGENHNRSRWSMWYFAQMNVGDIFVVPLYSEVFSEQVLYGFLPKMNLEKKMELMLI